MSDEADEETPLEQVAGGAVMAVTFLVGFGLLALGMPWFWIAFPVGFAGVLPATIGLVRLYERRREREQTPPDDREAALATLRERYAAGEIDEAEFERRVDRLLDTESIEDAEAYLDRTRSGGARDHEREPREPERE